MALCDKNGDGQITMDEFTDVMYEVFDRSFK
jgi:hypothetical protein